MARPSEILIQKLRQTADRIIDSPEYQWGHMGACNCGHLAQVLTLHSKAEIHKRAMYGIGDWNDQLNDYCPTSGLPFDDVVSQMLDYGFDLDDLRHLERLSDKRILARLPFPTVLRHNVKEDVALYFTLWADMMADDLAAENARLAQFDRQPALV